jgi:hypothetical protein
MSTLVDAVTGELMLMVEKTGKLWQALNVNFSLGLKILGSAGAAIDNKKC